MKITNLSLPTSPSVLVILLFPFFLVNQLVTCKEKRRRTMDRLPKCEANYVPLSPLTFLKRASAVYANRTSLIYRNTRFTWRQTDERCRSLASSLVSLNIRKNDVISVLAPNSPAMYEMHFAVPMAGAVLNAINTLLDAKTIATILQHSEAKIFFVDYEFVEVASKALDLLMGESTMPLVIVIDDVDSPTGVRLSDLEYEHLIRKGNPSFVPEEISDEWDPITLNYTSGTTSDPKGVVYSHRGAYLSTLSLILGWEMGTEPVYLWSLPMFHCNGWTFTWGVAARGGTNVCIRKTTAQLMYEAIGKHNVTHMCCAPIVFNLLLEAKPHETVKIVKTIQILTGGAPPPPMLVEKVEKLGFHVNHAYGLTEATGPALVCEWQSQWDTLSRSDKAKLKARQGVSVLSLADVDVIRDLKTMERVPHDGKTTGEIALRGSSIMKGYYKDEKENSKVFHKGWYLTGDVGVIYPDGYLEIKGRSKDVIISGGENICSKEVEDVLYGHQSVVMAAVVAMPHPRWGESPCAFVTLEKNSQYANTVTEADIIGHCRKNLSGFMIPKKVVFMDMIPRTATGKIQKNKLRAIAKILVKKEGEQKPSNKNTKVIKRDQPLGYEDQHQEKIFALSRL